MQRLFRWADAHDAMIRLCWESKCKRRITGNMWEAHHKTDADPGYVPKWISEAHWKELRARRADPRSVERAAVQKANRAKGQASHSGGSRSHYTHKRRMVSSLNKFIC